MAGQPFYPGSVPLEQRFEGLMVAVLRPGHEDRVAELLVRETVVPP